jgi:hypothetical protein
MQRNSASGFDRSIHTPRDEFSFFLFDARGFPVTRKRARLEPIRVVEASSPGEERR